MIMLRNILNC